MLKHRIQSAVLICTLLVCAVFWLPPVGILVLLLLICATGLFEFYHLLDSANIPHFKYVGTIGGLALIASTWVSLNYFRELRFNSEWLVLILLMITVFLRQFPQKNNPRPVETIAGTLLGVMYVAFFFNFFTRLLMDWGDHTGRLLVLYLVVVVKASDTGAFFMGCSFGRHKLIPRISPAKSWEGFFGGILAGILASILFLVFSHGQLGAVSLTWRDALVLGIFLPAIGTAGDLTESLFKRAAGVKDSGRIILGMGGILDVLDSLLFTAPILYVYARFFM